MRGHRDEGRPCPYTVSGSQPGTFPGVQRPHPVDDESAGASPYKYWNKDALSRWLGPENLGWAILDGVHTRVLIDNGARVNSVMPAYVHRHKFGVHPISELDHTLNPFGDRIPLVGLATPTINRVMQTMKESEMHSTPMEWQSARVAYEWVQGFQFRRASLGERLKFPTNTAEDRLDLDEKVLLADKCTIPGFKSVVAHGCTQRMMMMGH